MRKSIQILALASALIGGLALAVPVYAEETPSNSTKGSGMMGGSDMTGMMSMMTQMSQMMESCSKMMQSSVSDHGSDRPNEQPRKDAPAEPENKG